MERPFVKGDRDRLIEVTFRVVTFVTDRLIEGDRLIQGRLIQV